MFVFVARRGTCHAGPSPAQGAAAHREINMAKTDKSTKKDKPSISSADKLLKTGKDSKVELTEGELGKVTGGAAVDFFNKAKV
jgi:hypothetical protein